MTARTWTSSTALEVKGFSKEHNMCDATITIPLPQGVQSPNTLTILSGSLGLNNSINNVAPREERHRWLSAAGRAKHHRFTARF